MSQVDPGKTAPAEVAVTIPLCGDHVLVRRRSEAGPLDGTWEFPGGKVEEGETPKAAAIREMLEETGISASEGDLQELTVVAFDYPDRKLRIHFFLCVLKGLKCTPQPKATWVPLPALDSLRIPAANYAALEALKRMTEKGLKP